MVDSSHMSADDKLDQILRGIHHLREDHSKLAAKVADIELFVYEVQPKQPQKSMTTEAVEGLRDSFRPVAEETFRQTRILKRQDEELMQTGLKIDSISSKQMAYIVISAIAAVAGVVSAIINAVSHH